STRGGMAGSLGAAALQFRGPRMSGVCGRHDFLRARRGRPALRGAQLQVSSAARHPVLCKSRQQHAVPGRRGAECARRRDAAARSGAAVALVDEAHRLGGNGAPATLVRAVRESASITLLPATVAAGYYADHWVALTQQARMTKMRARAVVFATGVIEQPGVF